MKRLAAVLALVVAAGGLAGCSRKLGSGEGRLTVTGEAYVARPGKELKPVHKARVLHTGDRVVVKDGDGQVALAGGGALEVRAPVTFTFDRTTVLQSGEMLVEPAGRALAVATDNATVTVPTGATRLSRTLALTVTSYRGRSTVTSPGSDPLTVRAPRRATVAARGVLSRADGFDCHSADEWDRRFLADSCFLGDQVSDAALGFAGQLPPGEGHTVGFFRQLYPRLEQVGELTAALDTNQAPSENLVAAAIALNSTQGTFTDRWRSIFAFRDPGDPASHANINWGMVAIDQGIDSVAGVAQDVDAAITRSPKLFSPGTVVAAPALGSAAAGTGAAGTAAGTTARTTATTLTRGGQPAPTTTTTIPSARPTTSTTRVGVVPTVPSPSSAIPPSTTSPTSTPTTLPPPSTGTPADNVVDPLVDLVNNLLPGSGGSTSVTTTVTTTPVTTPITSPVTSPLKR